MITIAPPHVALNDVRAPATAQMRYTFPVGDKEKREHIIGNVVRAAKLTPSGRLSSVVICCHGNPGYLQLGEGFQTHHAAHFSEWRGKVTKIWLRACLVAARDIYGHSLAAGIARAAGCYVVASTELQTEVGARRLPYGQLDTYEGLLLCFGPTGRVTWQHRYPSTYVDHDDQWTRNPD